MKEQAIDHNGGGLSVGRWRVGLLLGPLRITGPEKDVTSNKHMGMESSEGAYLDPHVNSYREPNQKVRK